jgi:hypothetical protein
VPAGDTREVFGGLEPVTLSERDALIELRDSEPGPDDLVAFLSARLAPPEIRNTQGEPTVVCQARVQVADPDELPASHDSAYVREPAGDPSMRWCEYLTTDGLERGRATFALDGDELLVETNSEVRLQRALGVAGEAATDSAAARRGRPPPAQRAETT